VWYLSIQCQMVLAGLSNINISRPVLPILLGGGAYAATGVIKFDNVELEGNYSERELAKLIKKGGLRGVRI